MLATSSQWSNGFKTLTFTVRNGVNWSDGKPFGAADVAYTFNAMKSDKAIDLNALWSADGGPLTSVALKGTNQVVFTFKAPSQPIFYFVADQTPIVPQHIWSTLDQSKLSPYARLETCRHWALPGLELLAGEHQVPAQPELLAEHAGHPVPMIQEVDYPAFLSNTPGNLALSQGQAQWGGQYIPNVQSFYVAKDPTHRHIWFPPVLNVALVPNLTNPLLGKLPVRQAIAYALDKATVARRGERVAAARQPDRRRHADLPELGRHLARHSRATTPPRPSRSCSPPASPRARTGSTPTRSGQPLSFTIKTISGYSDWDASLQIITQELKAVGIAVTVQDENSTPYTTDIQGGHFQLAYAGSAGRRAPARPYYELRGWLFSGNIGSTNYSRFNSPSADALFNQYSAASPSQQAPDRPSDSTIMVDDLPFIPDHRGRRLVPVRHHEHRRLADPSNPYAQPSPYSFPDNGVVLTHLYPVRKRAPSSGSGRRPRGDEIPHAASRAVPGHPLGGPHRQLHHPARDAGQRGERGAGHVPERQPGGAARAADPVRCQRPSEPGRQLLSVPRNCFTGQFGVTAQGVPVLSEIASKLPWTLGLVGVTTVIAFVIGTVVGVVSAWRRGGRLDGILPPTLFIVSTIPVFFVGLLLIYVFAVKLNWLPLSGNYSIGATPSFSLSFIGDVLKHAILPGLSLVIVTAGLWVYSMRNNMITTVAEDYVKMGRAKGLPSGGSCTTTRRATRSCPT